jgi:hypothetical protein
MLFTMRETRAEVAAEPPQLPSDGPPGSDLNFQFGEDSSSDRPILALRVHAMLRQQRQGA